MNLSYTHPMNPVSIYANSRSSSSDVSFEIPRKRCQLLSNTNQRAPLTLYTLSRWGLGHAHTYSGTYMMQQSNSAFPDITSNTGARRLKLEVIECNFSALTTNGKEPETTRMNRTRTQILARTKPNLKVKNVQKTQTEPYHTKNWTEP